jgi:hypothetical protein
MPTFTIDFVTVLLRHRLIQPEIVRQRIAHTPLEPEARIPVLARLGRLASAS